MRVLHDPKDEKTILLELIDGSEYAFEQIYELYSPRLFNRLLKLVKIEAQAEEILQDVFLQMWLIRRSIDPEKSFRLLLFKIAENKVYDFFRKVTGDQNLESQLVALASKNHTKFV